MKEGKQSVHGQLLVGRTPTTHVFKLGGRTQLKRAYSRISKEKTGLCLNAISHLCRHHCLKRYTSARKRRAVHHASLELSLILPVLNVNYFAGGVKNLHSPICVKETWVVVRRLARRTLRSRVDTRPGRGSHHCSSSQRTDSRH